MDYFMKPLVRDMKYIQMLLPNPITERAKDDR